MSGFTALNVEPEDNIEEEIDDTKEIQLEEAFKLYQNALKLQSQGPEYFRDTLEAYKQLFQSEIFKYPEAISDYAHDQLDDVDVVASQPEAQTLAPIPTNAPDSSANSLPQLIYLSYKNRGQFVLEVAKHQLRHDDAVLVNARSEWTKESKKALGDFADALERDDTDIDLWKKAARVAEIFATQRIVRFCLESVLAGDDDAAGDPIDLSGLDEAYAAGELKEVLGLLNDDISLSQIGNARPKEPLLRLLKKRNDPYPFLPTRAKALDYTDDRRRPFAFQPAKHVLRPGARTWLSLAQAILQVLVAEQANTMDLGPGAAMTVELPDAPEPTMLGQTTRSLEETANPVVDALPILSAVPEVQHKGGKSGDADISLRKNSLSDGAHSSEGTDQPQEQITSGQTRPGEGHPSEVATEQDEGLKPRQINSPNLDSANLPTRKRSSTMAGNDDPPEARIKSKRLRARESMVDNGVLEEDVSPSLVQHYQYQLETYFLADQWMLSTANGLFGKLRVAELGTAEELRHDFNLEQEGNGTVEGPHVGSRINVQLLADLRQALTSWNDEKSQAILHGHGGSDFGSGKAGLTLFLQHSKGCNQAALETALSCSEHGLITFAEMVNAQWSNIHDLSFALLQALLTSVPHNSAARSCSYTSEQWPVDLKQNIVQIVIQEDEHLQKVFQERLQTFQESRPSNQDSRCVLEFAQGLFELHLDIYCSITNPSSQVDAGTRKQQRDRLSRWADTAGAFFNIIPEVLAIEGSEMLVHRFIWASTAYGNKGEDVQQDHVLLCLQNLRLLLDEGGSPRITLPNNAAMPEISITAVEREMSRLSTLDFFMSIFDTENSDAVSVIESLEPILEVALPCRTNSIGQHDRASGEEQSKVDKLVDFLESGDASLKLFLWKRLQNAYQSISYTPKVVSCQLRAIETIVQELSTARHIQGEANHRQLSMLKWLRDADDLVTKLLVKVLNETNPLECLDDHHLRSSMTAMTTLSRLIHGFALYEDSVRVGQISVPSFRASSTKTFEKVKDRFREMQVRAWTLQFTLLREAISQSPELFPTATDDLADYLRSVHNALGVRQYCKYSNKVLLKLVKSELLAIQTEEDYSADIAQVLFDLHGLRFAPGIGDVDHGCPTEGLDKKTALQLAPIVMLQANRVNIRDFNKNELKGTVDKIQHALGVMKLTPPLTYNKRTIAAFLKSPINPKDMFRCIKGVGDLPTKPIHGDSLALANSGWYFLLGHIALTKYRGVKRVNPTPTDDLDVAATFFRQDLEHGMEKWETWYRLAQVYEAKIEDDLIWNSTKLNESREDVAVLERNAIHAFSMSVAVAMRNADDNPDTAQKISEMFSEFGTRLYASSREPLHMEAFKADKQLRPYSSGLDGTMYKVPAVKSMQPYTVWTFAVYLFRRKFTAKPKHWTSYYTLGKCLWKLFCNPVHDRRRVSVEELLEALSEAIEVLPQKREKSNEPILEPHFKLVSIVHKLVNRKVMTPQQGVDYLQATPYSRKVRLVEDDQGPEWDRYILEILKRLGHADKSHWHHRIIARAAHVIFDDQGGVAGALGAKHEFTQQVFTKTMTLQVWKPEHERPGRHYVYTGRYVLFFVSLLNHLNDRSSLDQLVRRIRRRPTDFLDHQEIWEQVVITYVKMLRRIGKIPEGHDKVIFDSMNHDEFVARADKLESWAHDADNTSMVLDVLRDAIELKKLNNSLMKGTMIDDLIVDTYAAMYEAFVSQLQPEEEHPPAPSLPPAVPIGTVVSMNSLAGSGPVGNGRMRLGNLLTQTDGPSEICTSPSVPIGLGLHNSPVILGTPPPSSSIEPPRIPTPVKPGRVKTVTRTELRRRSELLLLKPPPIKTPVLSKKPVIEISTPTRDRIGSMSLNLDEAINGQDVRLGRRAEEIKEDVSVVMSRTSSRENSIHDSADDESELSEVEDMDDEVEEKDVKNRSMFPGLMARANPAFPRHQGEYAEEGDDDGSELNGDEDQQDDDQSEDRMKVEDDHEVEIQDSQDLSPEQPDGDNMAK